MSIWKSNTTFFFALTPDCCTYAKDINHCVQELSYYSQQGKQIVQMLLYDVVKLSSDSHPLLFH